MRRIEWTLVGALLACTMVYGVYLRLQDPLSTHALGAEDPYTHVVFTKEWAAQGYFADSFHLGTEMYPPGMHAWLAAFVPMTGFSMYEFARIAPAFFGALAILGMFALGHRLAGPAAGLAGAFVTAIMPEHIFRTELLFPTALDLALLPAWLLGFHLAIHGDRYAGGALVVGASIPLAIMHPWAVVLFAIPLAIYVVLRRLRGALDASGVWTGALALVVPVAFAFGFRWDASDTGFADFLSKLPGMSSVATSHFPGPLVFLGALAIVGALAFAGAWLLARVPRAPAWALWPVGALLLAGFPLLARDLPQDVDYVAMLGWVALPVALGGLALAFLRPSAVGDLAAATCAFLFPLTALDVFGSAYWPQRTVAYLTIGVALLAAVVGAELYDAVRSMARSEGSRAGMSVAAIALLGVACAGSAVAVPVDTYEWYRLYNEEQFDGFQHVARIFDEQPGSQVFIYTWQPALMVKTLTDPEHVWYSPKFFKDAGERAGELADVEDNPAYVLVDKYTQRAADAGKADLGFLEDDRYHLVYQSDDGGLKLYEVR